MNSHYQLTSAAGARQRGLALISALLIVAIVATAAGLLSLAQQLWMRQVENIIERARADFVQRGAVQWAMIVLSEDSRNSDTDHLGEAWAKQLPPLPAEGATLVLSATDAQGRFNLNSLWRKGAPSTADVGVFRNLLTALSLDPNLTDAVLDWLDPDSNTRPGGAEDVDYLSQTQPYRAANRYFASVDELRLVRGLSAEALERLRPYLVAIPAPTDINVNTAPATLLVALVPGLSLPDAEKIAAERERSPFKDVGQFQSRLPAGTNAPAGGLGVKSGYFLVMLDIALGRHRRQVEVLIERPPGGKTPTTVWQQPQPIVLTRNDSLRD